MQGGENKGYLEGPALTRTRSSRPALSPRLSRALPFYIYTVKGPSFSYTSIPTQWAAAGIPSTWSYHTSLKPHSIQILVYGEVWRYLESKELETSGKRQQLTDMSGDILLTRKGRIIKSLDDPVKTYIGKAVYDVVVLNSVRKGVPEELSAQLTDRMTITQLLSHTAGLTASGFVGYPAHGDHIKTSAEVLKGGLGDANSPPVYIHGIPGMQAEYSGGGSTILQAMLENIAGELGFASYASLMKAKVLGPLGMTRSFYCDAGPLPQHENNYATAYQNGTYPLENGQVFHVHPEQGAAGLWTTSLDLVKGLIGVAHTALGTPAAVRLNGNPWIRPDAAQEIFKKRSELAYEDDAYYCGFEVEFLDGEDEFPGDERLVRISHAGSNEGYRYV